MTMDCRCQQRAGFVGFAVDNKLRICYVGRVQNDRWRRQCSVHIIMYIFHLVRQRPRISICYFPLSSPSLASDSSCIVRIFLVLFNKDSRNTIEICMSRPTSYYIVIHIRSINLQRQSTNIHYFYMTKPQKHSVFFPGLLIRNRIIIQQIQSTHTKTLKIKLNLVFGYLS